jgi:uncharacterized protein YaiE (UPF0345 family)
MADDVDTNKAVALMMDGLHWAYDRAASAIPGLGSAEDLAKSHLAKCGGDGEAAINDLVSWQTGYAGAAGFLTNVGGVITMPITIPANLACALLIQLRMIAAIAYIRGYEIRDERVRTLAFLCLTGSASAGVLQEFAVNFGTKLTTQMVMKISGAVLTKINQSIGFRLVTKAGTTGLVNLTKIVPFIGGLITGAVDAAVTRAIASVAKEIFVPLSGPDLEGAEFETAGA